MLSEIEQGVPGPTSRWPSCCR